MSTSKKPFIECPSCQQECIVMTWLVQLTDDTIYGCPNCHTRIKLVGQNDITWDWEEVTSFQY